MNFTKILPLGVEFFFRAEGQNDGQADILPTFLMSRTEETNSSRSQLV
jgi:hypothetical protein